MAQTEHEGDRTDALQENDIAAADEGREQKEELNAAWNEFKPHLLDATKAVSAKVPEVVDAYLNRKAYANRRAWTQAFVDTGCRYALTALIVTAIAILAWHEVLSGDAVIGILGAIVGYLWGKSRREDHDDE